MERRDDGRRRVQPPARRAPAPASPDGAAASGTPGRSPGRFLAGDPLRGLAALGIGILHAGTVSLYVAGHSSDLTHGWPTPFGHIFGGALGACANAVSIFFLLSGYLIARPFVEAFAEERKMPAVVDYLRNRALRVVPAYWAAIAVVLLVAGPQGRTWSDGLRLLGFSEDWVNSPIRFDLGQAWTLNVEVRYYLAVPILAGLILLLARLAGARPRTRRGRLRLLGGVAVAGAVAIWALVPRTTADEIWTLAAQAHLFLLGAALAAAELGGAWRWLATRLGRLLGGAAVIGAVGALIWMQYPGSPLLALPGLDFQQSVGIVATLAPLVIVGVPILLQRAGAGCWRVLDNAPLRWLGARSYGFYLYQLGVLTELSHHAPAPGLYRRTFVFLVVLGVPIIMVLAELSWRLVERPAMRWKAARPRPDPSPPELAPPAASLQHV
ncbi:MAG: acyltransferase [Actinobacteria bacterium]|nr:acyltransferase [Actinomycetota bacterium]